MLGYDPQSERHSHNPDVHYRLYLGRNGKPAVICVQDFDYNDYELDRLLSNKAWKDEQEANEALRTLLADAAIILGVLPDYT
ncbi:hypothetical protein ACFY4C_39420 [Actinomadura viridis]|uniref:hypothetical protein n=1 Tax=Actinomadura viridis TaxID=58110 RepID=UPI0036D05A83